MDRITESFLDEFVAQHELEHLPQSQKFEHFAAFVTVRRHYNGESFDTADIHTGGSGDLGIDAAAILVNGSIITDIESLNDHADISGHFDASFIFVQADRGSSFDGKKISDFGLGVKDYFSSNHKRIRNAEIESSIEVMDELYKNGSKFRPGNPICRLYYVTTGTWIEEGDLEARRRAAENDLKAMQIFRDVELICLGAEGLQQLYRRTKNAVVREFVFARRTLLPDIKGVSEAYIGYIPVSEFIKIVQDESGEILGSLFLENVRDWQQYTTPVNDEIRETVVSGHSDRFVLMNNGITMIASNLRPLRGDQFQIEDFQIVNGCQTTSVLFDQKDEARDDICVPLRIISTKDENVVKSIIRGTNRQTKVEEDQFFALTDFAEQLEDYFETIPENNRVYYERRSGQYNRRAVHNTRIVPHRNLVKYVASIFAEIPHQASRRYTTLRDTVGKEIFAKGHKLDPYYVSAFSAYKLDVAFRTGRIESSLKPARLHILLAMRYLGNPAPMPFMNARAMEGYCAVITKKLWDNAAADELCASAASLAAEVADENFARSTDGEFQRDDIRSQSFTEKIIARCKEIIPRDE